MIVHTLPVGLMPTNCYIASDPETQACAVIDPGGEAEKIVSFIRDRDLVVKYILITHSHFDHVSAAAQVAKATGAPLGLHPDGIPMLEMGGGGVRLGYRIQGNPRPDILLSDGQTLEVGALRLHVLHVPGHDAGHVVFHEPAHKILFDGDVLLAGEIGHTNTLGSSYHQLMDNVCRKLTNLPVETVIYPGHGPTTTIGQECQHNLWLNLYRRATTFSSSLVPLQVHDRTRHPLFLVHPAGGRVFCYWDIARHLRSYWACYGLQAPELGSYEQLPTTMEEIAARYIQSLRSIQPEGPFLLGGWAMGAVIAYEMAQQLQAQGHRVGLLALIDSRAPSSEPNGRCADPVSLTSFVQELELPLQAAAAEAEQMPQLGTAERIAFVLEQARRDRVLPANIVMNDTRYLYQVYETNLRALKKYVLRPYAGPITLFRAEEQTAGLDEDLGWGAWAEGGLTVHVVPGNHDSLIRMPHAQVLVEHLKRHLRAAEIKRNR